MTISAIGHCSSGSDDSRTCSSSISCSDVPATSESNMNCRFSSSSADCCIGMFVCGKMIAPFLVQLGQLFEFRLKIIHRSVGLLLGGRVKGDVGRAVRRGRRLPGRNPPRYRFRSDKSVSGSAVSSSTGFCCNSCSTSAFSSSVGAWSNASDCWSCGANTSDCVSRCDNCRPCAMRAKAYVVGTKTQAQSWHNIR